jgi:hypothetical protein
MSWPGYFDSRNLAEQGCPIERTTDNTLGLRGRQTLFGAGASGALSGADVAEGELPPYLFSEVSLAAGAFVVERILAPPSRLISTSRL